jgi:hypothetical protein
LESTPNSDDSDEEEKFNENPVVKLAKSMNKTIIRSQENDQIQEGQKVKKP